MKQARHRIADVSLILVLTVLVACVGWWVVSDSQMRATEITNAAAKGGTVILDESSSGTTELTILDQLEIHLRAQLGSGYSWSLESTRGTALKFLGDKVAPPAPQSGPPIVGGANTQVFSFIAAAPGEVRLEFIYRRPFEKAKPPEKRVTYVVKVRK